MNASRWTFACLLIAIASPLASVSADGPTLLAIHADGPGTPEQAQPVMDELAARLTAREPALAGLRASYHRDLESARAAITAQRPAFAMMSLEAFLELRREHALVPIARAVPRGAVKTRHAIVGRPGGPARSADLQGKRLATTGVVTSAFLAMVLETEGPPSELCTIVPVKAGALRALRQVARGDVEAALVEESVWRSIEKSGEGPLRELAGKLSLLWLGPELPDAPVVKLGEADGAPLQRALVGLASDPASARLLESLALDGFAAAGEDDYREVVARHEAALARQAGGGSK